MGSLTSTCFLQLKTVSCSPITFQIQSSKMTKFYITPWINNCYVFVVVYKSSAALVDDSLTNSTLAYSQHKSLTQITAVIAKITVSTAKVQGCSGQTKPIP